MRYTKNTRTFVRLIFLTPLVLFLTTSLFATWALVPLEKLVAESDLIVTGTLHSATEDSEGIGKGYIQVETVVSGRAMTFGKRPLKAGDNLKIKWEDNWACAAGMHMGRVGKAGLWLLQVKNDGSVTAAYPGRFTSLDKLDEIRQLAERTRPKGSSFVDVAGPEKEQGRAVEFQMVDVSPFREYSPAGAALVLMIAAGLYLLLYKSRFRIR